MKRDLLLIDGRPVRYRYYSLLTYSPHDSYKEMLKHTDSRGVPQYIVRATITTAERTPRTITVERTARDLYTRPSGRRVVALSHPTTNSSVAK